MDLAQGRWNEDFSKIINSFQEIQLLSSSDNSGKKELSAANPGLTLKFNTLENEDELSRLLTMLDSTFAVSLIESQDNVL